MHTGHGGAHTVNRKERRRREKIKGKLSPGEQNLSEKISLFSRIPDACNTCAQSFDKKDKAMAVSWKVAVFAEQEIVKLFCPDCIADAKQGGSNDNQENQ